MKTSAASQTRPLNREDAKILSLSALGGALEFYDFIIFVFFAAVLGELFFPPEMAPWLRNLQTFGLFAAGYLARPLGGVVLAHFGDKLGRKRMFAFSIFLMSLPTLAMGLLPTYERIGVWAPLLLLLARVVQGAAIGGEIPAAWVFVSEHAPQRRVGLACGAVTFGLTGGILLGSLTASATHASFTSEEIRAFAWRLPFVAGGVFGLFSVYLRRWLAETPVFLEMQARKALSAELPLRAALREHRGVMLGVVMLTGTISAAVVVLILMTPSLLQGPRYALDPAATTYAGSVATFFLSSGCLFWGWLSDHLGRIRTVVIGSLALAAMSLFFYATAGSHPELLLPLSAALGLFAGVTGAIPSLMVQAFPPAVRFSGLSFSYNVAYAIFGGLSPLVATLLFELHGMGPALYAAAIALAGAATTPLLRRPATALEPAAAAAHQPLPSR